MGVIGRPEIEILDFRVKIWRDGRDLTRRGRETMLALKGN
jgi:hypothetical protein